MSPESEKELQARWIIRRDDPICTCKPENPRHKEGWQCVTKEQMRAFAKSEPMMGHGMLTDKTRKRHCWLWLHFSQDPKARRLSGRAEADAKYEAKLRDQDRAKDLGLDQWDDAAGMSELEKRMFE